MTNDWDDVLGDPAANMSSSTSFKFCGSISKRIASEMNSLKEQNLVERFEKLTGFFCYLDYQAEFWDLVKVITQGKIEDSKNRIAYFKNLPALYLVTKQFLKPLFKINSQKLKNWTHHLLMVDFLMTP